jgi:hypothetical protein
MLANRLPTRSFPRVLCALVLGAWACHPGAPPSPAPPTEPSSTRATGPRPRSPAMVAAPTEGGPQDWVRLFSALAKTRGVTVTDAELRKAVAEPNDENAFQAFEDKVHSGLPERGYATLYLADIDNDGTGEYVLAARNPTGEHNDYLVGVFRPRPDGTLVEVPIPVIGPSNLRPTFHWVPFLSRDREGVTMRFREDDGHFWFPEDVRLARYLWRDNAVRLLDRVPVPEPPFTSKSAPTIERCTVTLRAGGVVVVLNESTRFGTVTVDGALGTRRFNMRVAPYNGTLNLVFAGYGRGDEKPAPEQLTRMNSVVARLVSYGGALHLFLDGDYQPPVAAPQDGFTCH